ncbi:archaetidylserine decarboxylase [Candidatus Providencia siddallii]|uniref:Phosphatidylserine decarboxylase proenzyme n=1 Tax=Candidatus Providencia siddallii TaxID=1715285 RepID=A0ABM9NPV2_9GAMM
MLKSKIFTKYIIKLWITQFFGWFANKKIKYITFFMIKFFVKIYKININEAKYTNLKDYATFNDFFVRSLKKNARKIVSKKYQVAYPVDGTISQFGSINDIYLFQAKKNFYTLNNLLVKKHYLIDKFKNGNFITIYLSPSDYHRVHMPCDGLLKEMIYVPGDLFSVNLFSVKKIPNLFSRNERLICVFKTDIGLMIQILVGAIIVGSISTVWFGCVNSYRKNKINHFIYPDFNLKGSIFLKKGEEMGMFKLGSTVINLFEPNKIFFNNSLHLGCITRVGDLLAESFSNELSYLPKN